MSKTNVQRVNPYSPSANFENQHMHNASSDPQRDHTLNQQVAKSVRPQLPRDGTADMTRWQPGELPKGGLGQSLTSLARLVTTPRSHPLQAVVERFTNGSVYLFHDPAREVRTFRVTSL